MGAPVTNASKNLAFGADAMVTKQNPAAAPAALLHGQVNSSQLGVTSLVCGSLVATYTLDFPKNSTAKEVGRAGADGWVG